MRALYDSKSKTIGDRGIRRLFTKEAKLQAWLDVEAALALSQAEEEFIPAAAAAEIAARAKLCHIDLAEVERLTEKIGHGFVPFLKCFVSACGEESGKYVHYGVTTQNIQQTAQLLIMKSVQRKFLQLIADILTNLAALAEAHKDSVMAGRTHGRHAIPITYGYKAAVWISELIESVGRVEDADKRVFQVMMGGAVGAFNATGEAGRRVQERVAVRLAMGSMAVPSRSMSGHKAEYMMNLSLLAGTFHKIAEEVYATSIEEFGEVAEGFTPGTVGSSTMPQKVNPKLAKGIIANAQKLYALIPAGLYSCPRPFEGDSTSYMLFDGLLDEAMQLTAEILLRAEALTRTLQVNVPRLLENARVNRGLDNSEYVMMRLAKRLGKDKAHQLVYNLAMEAHDGNYRVVLAADPVVAENFTRAELDAMLEPRNYVGLSPVIAGEMAGKARQAARDLRRQMGGSE